MEAQFPRKTGRVQQFAVSCRQQSQQARDTVGIPDSAHVRNISVHDAPDVLAVPLASTGRTAGKGLRIAPGYQTPAEVGRVRRLPCFLAIVRYGW